MTKRVVYLAFKGFRVAPDHAVSAACRLAAEDNFAIERVRVCYRNAPDTAMLEIRLVIDSVWELSDLIVWAYNEGVVFIDPGTLPGPRRDYFRDVYAKQFGCLRQSFAEPVAGLRALADHMGLSVPDNLAAGTLDIPPEVATEWRALPPTSG